MTHHITIRVSCDYPPIPGAHPMWSAWDDAQNADDTPAMGSGATRGDAIVDYIGVLEEIVGARLMLASLTTVSDAISVAELEEVTDA